MKEKRPDSFRPFFFPNLENSQVDCMHASSYFVSWNFATLFIPPCSMRTK
jgi:hypothetical protein